MAKENLILIFIYFIMPIIGLAVYIRLALKMKKEIDVPPYFSMFCLFYLDGSVLIIILNSLFWKWSGMDSLGLLFLMFAGPIMMGIIAFINYKKKEISIFHKWAFFLSSFYFIYFFACKIDKYYRIQIDKMNKE